MKTILITGASTGIGKATALHFLHHGWNVIATMRAPEKETTLTNNANCLVTYLDVVDASSIQTAIQQGIEKFGSIDVLLNNAGYATTGAFESSTSAQMQAQYAVNVFGLMDVTRAILPHMRQQGSGVIINISSVGGIISFPFGTPYNSTKFAVEGFSEALYYEMMPFNIGVKIIEPGSTATNFRENIVFIPNEIAEYTPHFNYFFQGYQQATAHLPKSTAEDVAATIYQAATENTSRLRYVVGADSQFFIDAKKNSSEEDFTALLKKFTVKA